MGRCDTRRRCPSQGANACRGGGRGGGVKSEARYMQADKKRGRVMEEAEEGGGG